MTRSYLWLLGIIVLLALALSAVGRAPRRRAAPVLATAERAEAVPVALVIRGSALTPPVTSVPKGSHVALTVTNAGSTAAMLALLGYEDRLRPISLKPGATGAGEFTADRPGDDFAWTLDGKPAARLNVTGSHLVEGHR